MTGMTVDEYKAMMLAGGRPIDGWRIEERGTLTWPGSLRG